MSKMAETPTASLQADSTALSLFVKTSDDEVKKWDRHQIERVLIEETGAPKELAEEIAKDVEITLVSLKIKNTSTVLVRELVNAQLIERGYKDYALSHSRFGLPARDIEKIVYSPTKENSNVLFSAESIHKYIADAVFKQYTLEYLLPVKYRKPHLAKAHLNGDIHIHDLDYFVTRPYCSGHDLRYLAKYGLVMDGTGRSSATAKPAKAPEVLLLHAAKFLGVSQSAFSGAQAYSIFNPIVAPYLVGKTDKQINQLAQMFIFEMAQMAVARGAQVVFSDLNLDFGIPNIIADAPATGPKGKVVGVYGDYVDESNRFAHAMMDVYAQGDSRGVPFMFPKPLVKVRKEQIGDPEFEEFMLHSSEVSATKGNPYYVNQTTYEDENISM